MSTFAIGDLQGCRADFERLLERLDFDPSADRLLLAGDLVNRGPDSLGVLRFVRSLGERCMTVLGNHDLHLLAAAHDRRRLRPDDTLEAVLDAPDAGELLEWLLHRPLAWRHTDGSLLIHAGVPPQWTTEQTLSLAAEASGLLKADAPGFFAQMYGDQPDRWEDGLQGFERTRFVVNCLTRLRYCTADGRLRLRDKLAPGSQSPGAMPWFAAPSRQTAGTPIVFGHWSTLGRIHWPEHQVWCLDTGAIWGGQLSALQLETGHIVQIDCERHRAPSATD